MSITAIQWAWTRQGCSPGAKLLLLALADHCNGQHNGCECWPSLARLANMTGLSKASVCKYADELERLGHIRRDRSKGRASTVYRLVQLSATQTVQEPQLSATQTVTVCHTDSNCPPRGQEPGIEPGIEPEILSAERAREPKPSTRTGSRLTLSTLPPEWATWANTQRPDLDPQHTWELFHDYWTAKPGTDGLKTDWFATWRNWVRRERSPNGRPAHATARPSTALAPLAAKDFTVGATRPEDLPDWARDCAGHG